ncbi:SAGA-associated factor 29 [Ceratocystis fimbriata CBS 114723]|uniref:SAGA-associated factor 29 n=1 Tax=Ceratocystis fimbriata CBS 114723 TaxID=1035309 RepID=A0A2C5X277_9PEZI|nr:SAGA-associated factor 29 [Ceratocystis fimbriata CBS 114723]
MSQRNRSGRGSARNNGASHGEEVSLWELCREKINESITLVNEDNANLDKILALDSQAAEELRKDSQPAYRTLAKMEDLCRTGVKAEDTASAQIKSLIEQLTILRGVQSAKEQAATSDEKPTSLGPTSRAGASRTRDREREREQREREREREQERKRDRDHEREREKERERDRTERAEREKEREKDRDKDRSTPVPTALSASATGGNTTVAAGSSLYDFEGGTESPVPSPVGGPTSRRAERAERNSQRDSIPPVEDDRTPGPSDKGSGTPSAHGGAGSGSGVRAKPHVFAKGDAVAFKPKTAPGESPSDWILGEVKAVLGEGKSRRYKVLDVEPEPEDASSQKEYRSSASSMIPITAEAGVKSLPDWEPGKKVLAMYPQTTTFYSAEVISTAEGGKVNLRFDGENDYTTMQQVERRFVIDFRA